MKQRIATLVIMCLFTVGTLTGIPWQISPENAPVVYAASYPALKTIHYVSTGNQRNDIAGYALSQVGYKESGNNNTYFGYWFGLNKNPWCAMFVSWCAAKAGVSSSIIPRLASADRGWAKRSGVYYPSKHWGGSYTPKRGDLIYFSWSVKDWADHIGIVSGTGKSGGKTYVYTVEGNKHDKVCECSYTLDNKYILGYASPKYKNYVPKVRVGDTYAAAKKALTAHGTESDPSGSRFSQLRLLSKKQTKKSITISFVKVKGASRYAVFAGKCGAAKKLKPLTITSKTNLTVKKVAGQKVRKKTYYKFLVVALDKDNKVVSTSKMIHVATAGGTVSNPKKVVRITPSSGTKTMTIGGVFRTNFKQINPPGKKVKKHRKLKYASSNSEVAAVNSSGQITAIAPGTCYVYAFTQNGRYSRVKITVKQPLPAEDPADVKSQDTEIPSDAGFDAESDADPLADSPNEKDPVSPDPINTEDQIISDLQAD